MGSEGEMIPCLDFGRSSGGVTPLEEGSEGWKAMSKKVIEACENHGCFLLMCDEIIPKGLKEEMFTGMTNLFELPDETKKKYVSPKAYSGYQKKLHTVFPLCETFRIDDSTLLATSQDFTNLMWPQGNPSFCETLKSMNSKVLEICLIVLKMIMDGYGLPKHYSLDSENMISMCDTRLSKYEVPTKNSDFDVAMVAHTDKSTITFLCQNDIQGLQVFSNTGKWIDLNIPPNGFVVIIGDVSKAWSNGRLEAAQHRVVMRGEKERKTFVFFAGPKEDMVIEVPSELMDKNMHPLRYRPFKYGDYLHHRVAIPREKNVLEDFAGL